MKAIHVLALALVLSLLVVGLALANGSVERPRHVVGSGMSDSATSGVALRGTLGQAVIGSMSAGDITLGQGFWHGGAAAQYRVYLPLVLRQSEG
jgi:hypothetical protein